MFGLEPNYGCCTANFNQGWPKLALSTFLYHGDTVASVLPLPGEVAPLQVQKTLKGLCRRREMVEADRAKTKKQVVTKLTKAPLVPLRAASLLANAVSAFKGILSEKE